ncbi:MAG: hypothetical protein ACRYHA_25615 [Janthinobacterium lividum]
MTEKNPVSVFLTDVATTCVTPLMAGFQKRNVSCLPLPLPRTIVSFPGATRPTHKGFQELARISLYKIE